MFPAQKRYLFGLLISIVMLSALFMTTASAGTSTVVQSGGKNRCTEFTFDGTDSIDPDHQNLSYYWDLGDGQTSTEPTVTHTYDKSGEYTVTLTITDNSGLQCSSAVTSQNIRVSIPPRAQFSSEDFACVTDPLTFDATASTAADRGKLDYTWDFADGTKSTDGPKIQKTFAKGGDYVVTLTVTDPTSHGMCSADKVEKTIHVNQPPTADAGPDSLLKCVSETIDMLVVFDGSNSSDSNNDTLSYTWDFGDGETEEGMRVSHQYTQAGAYTAKLIVQDSSNSACATNVDFVAVKLNYAPQAHAGDDLTACPGEDVTFDGTKSYDAFAQKGTLNFKWFFGDGEEASGMQASHKYRKPGKYQASVSVENTLNPMCPPSRDSREVTINSTPTVNLSAPQFACVNADVAFDASSSNDPDGDTLEYYWSFGDGAILQGGAKVTHIYTQGGSYRVSVIVDDGKNSSCSTATASAMIAVNTPPIADAGQNLSCCVDRTEEFNASASTDPDGNRLTYTWNFGDGTEKSGEVVTHGYKKSGAYNVTVTVDDNSGTACSKSTTGFVAAVNAAPVPVIKIRE